MTSHVTPTTPSMLPDSPWLRLRPIYPATTGNTAPVGVEPVVEQPTALPWGTAPVPPLQALPGPRVYPRGESGHEAPIFTLALAQPLVM